jgi:hypothetical protein
MHVARFATHGFVAYRVGVSCPVWPYGPMSLNGRDLVTFHGIYILTTYSFSSQPIRSDVLPHISGC